MVTFEEFLTQFNEEVEETFEQIEMSDNAKTAVIIVMKDYLKNRKFNPLELMELFENACYHAMGRDKVSISELRASLNSQAPKIITEHPDYSDFPEMMFDEGGKMRSR